jgi:hypothetical protein
MAARTLEAARKNPKHVQMWLGHSDPGFTLRTYVHLIDDGLGDADFLDAAKWSASSATRPPNAADSSGLKAVGGG